MGETTPIPNPAHCCACAAAEEVHTDRAVNVDAATWIVRDGPPGALRDAAEEYLMRIFTAAALPSFS